MRVQLIRVHEDGTCARWRTDSNDLNIVWVIPARVKGEVPSAGPEAIRRRRSGSSSDLFRGMVMDDKERFEAVCALVDGSIGYFTPGVAARVVEAYERGETRNACERCLACFGGDLRKMVEADLRFWAGLREARKEGVRAFVRQAIDLDGLAQDTLGLLYPTLAL